MRSPQLCRSTRSSFSNRARKARRPPADLAELTTRPGEGGARDVENGAQKRAIVVHPEFKSGAKAARAPADRLAEAEGLARAIGLDIAEGFVATIAEPKPGTLFGKGKVDEIAQRCAAAGAELVIVDGSLTPVQQRNLEKAWTAKVLDRTGLILEIFGARARTREGQLQVELAHLTYQKSRLVRSWTHLERQRGALGFIGGPGETQIEMDRRLISERIVKIKRQLETVVRTRELQRENRRSVPYRIVALVGYTNAGKSTLFNRLTRADVLVKDMLFATLDPTLRLVRLPSGRKIILSDTVGFISDLPVELVAAFRATLEDVLEADLLLHVRDASSPSSEAEAQDVREVLAELGIDEANPRPTVEVLNKLDRLSEAAAAELSSRAARDQDSVALSALTGEGVDRLLARIDTHFAGECEVVDLDIGAADGSAYAWLHAHAEILAEKGEEDRVKMRVRFAPEMLGRFTKQFSGDARILPQAAD
ncbi:MAG: GTPase HflX [Alphaproteobacteria bacterium]|nr:GTPase HflX [Alphaproteobacteria bacterium]